MQRKRFDENLSDISSIRHSTVIKHLQSQYGQKDFSLSELLNYLQASYPEITSDFCINFIKKLINLTLIVTELQVPSAVTDPLDYVICILKKRGIVRDLCFELSDIQQSIYEYNALPSMICGCMQQMQRVHEKQAKQRNVQKMCKNVQ